MVRLIPLETQPDSTGRVNYLVDTVRQRYVRLAGMNTDQAVSCVHAFLCKHDVFGAENQVIRRDSLPVHVPEGCADYSCVMNFYDLMIRSRARLAAPDARRPWVTSPQLQEVRRLLTPLVPISPVSETGRLEVSEESGSEEASVRSPIPEPAVTVAAWNRHATSVPIEESEETASETTVEETTSEETASEETASESSEEETESSEEPEPTPPPKSRRSRRAPASPVKQTSRAIKEKEKSRRRTQTTSRSKKGGR